MFKKDAIFVVDGDGPGESGPSGNEFSPPQSLASRYGCVDHRSVVVTPDGIVYRSTRGIEMLTRSLSIKPIGQRVQTTVDNNLITTGACVNSSGRVHITLSATEAVTGVYPSLGAEIVYDLIMDCWSVHKHTSYSGTYGQANQCVGAVLNDSVECLVYADSVYGARATSPASFTDIFSYVPFKIETGWIKQGPQARQRISDVLLLAKKRTAANHALTISLAYDYSDTYTQTNTWEPGALNALTLEELNLQPTKQQVLAIRIKIEDKQPAFVNIVSSTDATPIVLTLPTGHGFVTGGVVQVLSHLVNVGAVGQWVVGATTDTTIVLTGSVGSGAGPGGATGTVQYPMGTGAGCDILAITAEVAPKQGAPKLAAGQKA